MTLLKLLLAVLETKRRTPSASLCCQARRVAVSRPHCDRIAVRLLNLTGSRLVRYARGHYYAHRMHLDGVRLSMQWQLAASGNIESFLLWSSAIATTGNSRCRGRSEQIIVLRRYRQRGGAA